MNTNLIVKWDMEKRFAEIYAFEVWFVNVLKTKSNKGQEKNVFNAHVEGLFYSHNQL